MGMCISVNKHFFSLFIFLSRYDIDLYFFFWFLWVTIVMIGFFYASHIDPTKPC